LQRQWGSATPRLGAGAHTARSTDLQFVPVLTSLLAAAHASQPPAELAVRHPARACLRGPPRHSPGPPVPSARLWAIARPSVFSERASPWGARVRGRLFARPARTLTVAPVLPRISAGEPEPTAGGEGAVAPGVCSRRPVDRRDLCCCRPDP